MLKDASADELADEYVIQFDGYDNGVLDAAVTAAIGKATKNNYPKPGDIRAEIRAAAPQPNRRPPPKDDWTPPSEEERRRVGEMLANWRRQFATPTTPKEPKPSHWKEEADTDGKSVFVVPESDISPQLRALIEKGII